MMLLSIKRTGGQEAWRDGYFRREPMSYELHDEWYWESYNDGHMHALDDKITERAAEESKAQTKAIRAKFKAIRAGKWL